MDDTRAEIAEKMREMLQQKTPAERLKMGCSMNATSKYLVARAGTSIYSGIEARQHIFSSFYGTDFDPETRKKIIAHLGSSTFFPTEIDFEFSNIPVDEKAQGWWKAWLPLIQARKERPHPEQSRLLYTLSKKEGVRTWQNIKYCTNLALTFVKNGKSILGRTSEIKTSRDPDGIIDDLCAELRTIPYLLFKGFRNIAYYRKDERDFSIEFEGNQFWVETTYVHGPDFKTQELFNKKDDPVIYYKIQPDKLINRLLSVYQKKENQVGRHHGTPKNTLLVIITDLEETYEPWLEPVNGTHPILQFILDRDIPTVVFGAGSVYEPPGHALEGIFGKLRIFDWNAFTFCS